MKTKLILLVALLATAPAIAAPQPNPTPAHWITIDYVPGYYRLALRYWLWLPYSILP